MIIQSKFLVNYSSLVLCYVNKEEKKFSFTEFQLFHFQNHQHIQTVSLSTANLDSFFLLQISNMSFVVA